MLLRESVMEMAEYRLILISPPSHEILAVMSVDGAYYLPSIHIRPWTRPAEQLQKTIRLTWKLHVLVLDFLPASEGYPVCAVAEVLALNQNTDFRAVGVARLSRAALGEQQRTILASILSGRLGVNQFPSQLGWIDEAIAWLESVTDEQLSSKREIEQYNAGGGFALLRFRMKDGSYYWLKSTGHPNAHERSVTTLLSELCGEFLPRIIASRPAWNAWLMSEEATPVAKLPTDPLAVLAVLGPAVESMAVLQEKTSGHSDELLDAGAVDQRMGVFQQHNAELFDYLDEAMSQQISTKAPRLGQKRIRDLRAGFDVACQHLEILNICETVLHGDLNYGNILAGVGYCQFIDWSEAYIGHPLISLEHLLLLNKTENLATRHFINSTLRKRYLDRWNRKGHADDFREALVYIPMLAIASTLYGRGDWLCSPQRNEPHRQSYARSLARHMERAAEQAQVLVGSCH